jgi:hypothetical protein
LPEKSVIFQTSISPKAHHVPNLIVSSPPHTTKFPRVRAIFPIQARLSFARRTREFFVTNDEKYQTCLIFGLHVTNEENAVNVARTRGNFVDPTCHE